MSDTEGNPLLPAHIEGTIEAIARLHADHHSRTTPFQAFIAKMTARAGRPSFVAWLAIAMTVWVAINVLATSIGRQPLDAPPFAWLELAASLAALFVTVMILSTQRRDDELASHREQLVLELAILADRKSAKIIQLLEELRRDAPTLRDRVDHEAAAMSSPTDPHAVLSAIEDTHKAAEEQPSPAVSEPTRVSPDRLDRASSRRRSPRAETRGEG